MNLRALILTAKDLPLEKVEVPEWSCTVFLKSLSGAERLSLEKDLSSDSKNDGPALCRVVCATLCDEQGNLVFDKPEDVDVLNKKSVKVLHRLFEAALKLNAFGKSDVDALQKN